MAYMKFKELSKYFNFKTEISVENLPEYVKEYAVNKEHILLAYKNDKDYALFTDKSMVLFDRDPVGLRYKKIHIFPYNSISSGAINFKRGKVELLFSLDSGYQLHINFINMHHDGKEKIKPIFIHIMKFKI